MITPDQARALSSEPWYMKKIKEAANKNFYDVDLECKTIEEASTIGTVLAELGYNTDIHKVVKCYGPTIQLTVSW